MGRLEVAEELRIRRQQQLTSFIPESLSIRDQAAIKLKEFFILPIRLGIDLRGGSIAFTAPNFGAFLGFGDQNFTLSISLRTDLLRSLSATRTEFPRHAGPLRFHAVIDR